MTFLEYILKNNIDNKLYSLAFMVGIMSYSFWQPIEDLLQFSEDNKGKVFFIGIAFAFCCYTSAYMFTKWDSWRWFPMFVFFICFSRFTKEVYYLYNTELNPEKYDIFDYVNFLITIFIVFNYYVRHRYKKYKDETN